MQCYSTGQPQEAVALLETASGTVASMGTPKMTAMLAARSARARSKAGSRRDCARQLHQARAALDRGPHSDDAPVLYWVTHGEIEMIAGSSALDRGAHAVRCLGGVDSARSASAITGLRAKLAPHAASPAVREFLDATRQ